MIKHLQALKYSDIYYP